MPAALTSFEHLGMWLCSSCGKYEVWSIGLSLCITVALECNTFGSQLVLSSIHSSIHRSEARYVGCHLYYSTWFASRPVNRAAVNRVMNRALERAMNRTYCTPGPPYCIRYYKLSTLNHPHTQVRQPLLASEMWLQMILNLYHACGCQA